MLIPLLPGDGVPRKEAGVETGRMQIGVRIFGGILTVSSRSLRVGGKMEGGFAAVFIGHTQRSHTSSFPNVFPLSGSIGGIFR